MNVCVCVCLCAGILVCGTIIWGFHNPTTTQSPSHLSSWMVNISQLVSLVQALRPGTNSGTLRNAFVVADSEKRKASPREVEWLIHHAVLKTGASNVQLITIQAAVRVLETLHIDGSVITELKEMKTAQPIQPPPQPQAPPPLTHVVCFPLMAAPWMWMSQTVTVTVTCCPALSQVTTA